MIVSVPAQSIAAGCNYCGALNLRLSQKTIHLGRQEDRQRHLFNLVYELFQFIYMTVFVLEFAPECPWLHCRLLHLQAL